MASLSQEVWRMLAFLTRCVPGMSGYTTGPNGRSSDQLRERWSDQWNWLGDRQWTSVMRSPPKTSWVRAWVGAPAPSKGATMLRPTFITNRFLTESLSEEPAQMIADRVHIRCL
ncbi:hypothetical protein PCANC_06283 [Puccinia coronata f. sp. avenae]|uniref:Uncharacterized protein n=1 Tax=Puccinia coronata f. sp. avenae TaxID=200324 RepID=A0A2N5VRP8_9BASI|nr:hypothetical protein PCANC_06283 [Puccinia coronata f. sp. avenae]